MSSGFSISYLNGLEGVMQDCLQEFVTYVDEKCAEAGPGGEAVIDISLLLGNLAFVRLPLSSLPLPLPSFPSPSLRIQHHPI